MAFVATRLPVAPPARTPLPYGLMSAAQVVDETDVHWRNGIWFEAGACGRSNITTQSCAATGGAQKAATTVLTLYASNPFTVYTLPICSSVGMLPDEAERRAVGALTSGEARAVERELWTGEFGTNPHLAANSPVVGSDGSIEQTAATVIVTGAVDVVEGLALMEEALGSCYGNEGVIHVPPSVLTHMSAWTLFTKDGPRLRTSLGHLVAAGAGYPGTAPDGSGPASGVRWIYGTGAVVLRRTAVETFSRVPSEILDRSKNNVVFVAERTYVIGWECCHLAIPINIGGITSGAVGS